jgi:hypothetical protein
MPPLSVLGPLDVTVPLPAIIVGDSNRRNLVDLLDEFIYSKNFN